jgi:iron complex transport system ATP-binding protein
MLKVSDIRHSMGGKTILDGIGTVFEPGKFHVIVGPNGSGKSTFLKVFSGELRPTSGHVTYDGVDVFSLKKDHLARIRSVMSQNPELHFPLRVYDIVMMGRYPHFGLTHTRHDEDICARAMSAAGVSAFADRDYLTLSGGEQQRVQFARCLAQIWEPADGKARYLFLDEAVSHLDLKYQHQVLGLARGLTAQGVTVIAILHDLNLSITYGDRILFLNHGRMAHDIHDKSEITGSMIKEVFDIDARVIDSGEGDRPVIVF